MQKRRPAIKRSATLVSRTRPRTIVVTLALFVLTFVVLELSSYTTKSATWDEPIHVTMGYLALTRHDYRADPEHPPFLRMWAALPLAAMRGITVTTAAIDRETDAAWVSKLVDFAHEFLYIRNDADRLLYAARFMIVVWGIVLGLLVFAWAYEWLGFLPALIALTFYTLEPNIAAHASLVTTDLGLTCFMFGTVYFLWRTARCLTVANVASLTACFSLAVVSKFSAILLGPIVVLLLAVAVWQRSAVTLRVAGAIIGLLAVAAFVSIWAIYGFRYAPSPSPPWLFHLQQVAFRWGDREGRETAAQRVPLTAAVAGWIDHHHLLPNAFTQGFLLGQAKAQGRWAFLAGSVSHGWWYYFPVAFLIKTPIALLVLAATGGVVLVKRRSQLGLMNEAFVALPIAVYGGVAMASQLNIGLRHILPIYPFVLLVAAAAARELMAKGQAGRVALGVVALVGVLEFVTVYPHTLTFFNQFVGGPRNGYKYLADSNLDWGQDLKLLKQWMDRNSVPHVNLAYFGRADPAYYGINATHLLGAPSFARAAIHRPTLPGYVAISVTHYNGVYLGESGRFFYRPFHYMKPVAEIGNSIRVYWVTYPWW